MELYTLTATITNSFDHSSVTFYTISCYHSTSKSSWTLNKRYSEFDSLFNSLDKQFSQVPSLPSKAFWKKFSSTFLEERKAKLAEFVSELVVRQDFLQTFEVQQFFNLSHHIPGFLIQNIDEVHHEQYSQIPFAIVALDLEYLIIALNPGNLERIKLTWTEGEQSEVRCQRASGQALWTIRFPLRISCLEYSKELTVMVLGFEHGGVSIYRLKSEIEYREYEEFTYISPHVMAVIGVMLDFHTSDFFTCSQDRKIKKLNLQHEVVLQELGLDCVPSDFAADLSKQKLFVANSKSGILVLDTNTLLATMSISFSKLVKICLIGNGILFAGCSTGTLNIYKESILVTTLLLKSKITSIKYSTVRKEVLIGNESGYISIWTRNGKLLRTWKAHDKSVSSIETSGNLVITAGIEGIVLYWQLPIFWVDPEFEKIESIESEIQAKTQRVLTTQQKIKEIDDLKGWDKT